MAEIDIKHDGRQVDNVNDSMLDNGSTVKTITYTDGAYIKLTTDTSGKVNVESNKTFHIMPDGKTVHLVD